MRGAARRAAQPELHGSTTTSCEALAPLLLCGPATTHPPACWKVPSQCSNVAAHNHQDATSSRVYRSIPLNSRSMPLRHRSDIRHNPAVPSPKTPVNPHANQGQNRSPNPFPSSIQTDAPLRRNSCLAHSTRPSSLIPQAPSKSNANPFQPPSPPLFPLVLVPVLVRPVKSPFSPPTTPSRLRRGLTEIP